MKIKRGSTSVRRLIFIADTSSTTGAGLANLVFNSSNLVAYYFAGDLSNEVQITLVTATLGTFASGGFVAVDNTNMPGWYEIGIPDAALDGGNAVAVQLRGATNMAPVNIYVELDAVDYQDATAFGISRIDAAITSRMATYTQPTGFLAATFPTAVASPTNITAATGVVLSGVTHTGAVIPTVSTVTNGVTVTTNNDKTGYTASTVSDKTGYSLLATTGLGNQTANITGTITTVTNLTNAATSGDLTAAMKASVNAEVDTALADIHLDHLLATDYDPASKPGVSTALLNELIESDGGVSRYTANALEQGPSGGGGVADWTSDERTAIRAILGIPGSGTTPADPTTGILDTIRDLVVTVDTVVDAIEVDTQDIQSRLPSALVSGRMDSSVGAMAANTLTASALASDAVTEIQSGLSTLDASGVRSAVGLASANLDTQLSAIDDSVDSEVGAIKTVTDKLDTAMELDGAVYRFTVNALEQAPSGGGGGTTDWTTDERTAIRSILGIPGSGTTPADPTVGIMDTIRDLVVTVDTVVDAIEVDTQNIQSRLPTALVSGRIDASVGAMANNVVTASAIASDAITDAKVASDVTIASVTGSVGSVTSGVTVSDKTGFKLASDGLALVTAWTVGITGNITGNLSGSVGSVTGLTASNLDAAVSSRLAPTVSGRTLDVTATGAAGIDWANVENQSASVGLSDTYMNNVAYVDQTDLVIQLAAGALGPGAIDTDIKNAVWNGLPSSGYTNGSFGDRILISTSDQREVAITGSNHIAADIHELQAGVITAGKFAAGAIDANALAADAALEIVEDILQADLAGYAVDSNIATTIYRLFVMTEADGADFRFTTNALEQAPAGGGGGGTDWTANERTAIRSILGFDASGTVSLPTVGVMDAIKDKTDLITSSGISIVEDRVNNDTITMQYNESTTATVNLDENTTSATLQFVVSRPDGTDILTIANGSVTRTSTSFSVTITTAVTATLGQYLWSLRDITGGTNRVITKGVLTVQNAASA